MQANNYTFFFVLAVSIRAVVSCMSKTKKPKRGRPTKNDRDKITENVTIRLPVGGRHDVKTASDKTGEKPSEFMRTAVLMRVTEVIGG